MSGSLEIRLAACEQKAEDLLRRLRDLQRTVRDLQEQLRQLMGNG